MTDKKATADTLMGVGTALWQFRRDEGHVAAVTKAERWRDTLEEMHEVANFPQSQACRELLVAVREFLLSKDPTKGDPTNA